MELCTLEEDGLFLIRGTLHNNFNIAPPWMTWRAQGKNFVTE